MNDELKELRVRRIVTGHTDAGQAMVAADEQIAGTGLAEDEGRTSASPMHGPRASTTASASRAGDVVVPRGTNHRWHNRGQVPCRLAWLLLDTQAVEVAGRRLGASWRHDA